ncbi:M23 family metallopeptidase [Antrihabitans sp. YC3-6]|uniref:M23 family metallopeptidase n=2 Tax=Antrihabitans stalagmiti TaxID=2799499 RepID=A0A934NT34_9NOCA|nr:M23 family metallopeptidase [Antrihabitans stalagmiti]
MVLGGVLAGAPVVSAAPSYAPPLDQPADSDPYLVLAIATLVSESLVTVQADGSLDEIADASLQFTDCMSDGIYEPPVGAATQTASGALFECAAALQGIDPIVGRRLLAALDLDRLATVLDAESIPHDGAVPHSPLSTAPSPPESDTGTTPQPSPRIDKGSSSTTVPPTTGTVTSLVGDGRGHGGIDIANKLGTPIVAVADGEVISAGPAQGYGLWVRIRHNDGTVTTYGHNQGNLVSLGQRVRTGQQIAVVGNRGDSSGPHLHFEVESPSGQKVDPTAWLASRGAGIADPDE